MKKSLVLLLTTAMMLGVVACGKTQTQVEETATEAPAAEEVVEEAAQDVVEETEEVASEVAEEPAAEAEEKSEGVMTYAEYDAAELDSEVTIETYVQAKQGWWEDKAKLYTQDQDGGYFIYDMPCTEEEYNNLPTGTKIKVTGYKSEWSGEVEIVDATFEIEDGNYVATALDVTDLLGTDDLIKNMNKFVAFNGMTVEASTDAEGNEVPFLYNWDGSGEEGSDLYFNVSYNGQTYNFTVESYLCGADTEVYQAVKNFNIGDTVDLEGFLYWYEGPNPHITKAVVK